MPCCVNSSPKRVNALVDQYYNRKINNILFSCLNFSLIFLEIMHPIGVNITFYKIYRTCGYSKVEGILTNFAVRFMLHAIYQMPYAVVT